MAGSITLQEVAAHTGVLAVRCSRCERTGRYRMATLIELHGRSFPVPELLRELSVACVKRQAVSRYDLCGVHCPALQSLPGRRRILTLYQKHGSTEIGS
jgi:hypothetical protein